MGVNGSERQRPEALPFIASLVAVASGVLLTLIVADPEAGFGLSLARLGFRTFLAITEVLLLLPALLLLLLSGIHLGRGLALRAIDRRTLLLSLAAGAAVWVGSMGLLQVQYALWQPERDYIEAFTRLHRALKPKDFVDGLGSVAAIALVPALCEEALIRGVLLPSLLSAGAPFAALVSSLVFGLLHWDAYRFPFTFSLGIALALLRLRSGSLIPPVLAHAVVNTITFLLARAVPAPGRGDPRPEPLLGAVLLLAGIGGTVFVLGSVGGRQPSGPGARAPLSAPAHRAAGPTGPAWFYVRHGQREGPVELAQIVDLIVAGHLPADTLVWRAGFSSWAQAKDVAEIQARLPPPVPPGRR